MTDQDIEQSLIKIAESQVPHHISYDEILSGRVLNQTLHLRIFENQIYLLNGLNGEPRHADIIEQLFDMIDNGYTLPNVQFKYYTMDTVFRQDVGNDAVCFTIWDDSIYNNLTRRILAPSCWFHGQNSGIFQDNSPFITYQNQINDILDYSEKNYMPFSKKENSLIFKGQVELYPHRKKIIAELKDKISICSEFLVHEKSIKNLQNGNVQYCNPMRNLSNYRYQLITAGAPRNSDGSLASGTCRTMYMLATGSIIFYVTNGAERKEWWQYAQELDGIIQYCKNTDDVIEKIKYFEANRDEAERISKIGFLFAKNYLHKSNVRKYWYHLLKTYENRCTFQINGPAGHKLISAKNVRELVGYR